jgi:hypothetical protein
MEYAWMRISTICCGVLAGMLGLTFGSLTPASAEFFGCHDKRGQLLYTYNGTPSSYRSRSYSNSRYSTNLSAQRLRYGTRHSPATYFHSRRYWNDRSRW